VAFWGNNGVSVSSGGGDLVFFGSRLNSYRLQILGFDWLKQRQNYIGIHFPANLTLCTDG